MFLLVPAHPGSPGQRAIKRLCVCVCVCNSALLLFKLILRKDEAVCQNVPFPQHQVLSYKTETTNFTGHSTPV